MNYRPLGDSGLTISEIGLGAWQLANPDWGVSDKEDALRIVERSLESGCTFFDTAPTYGDGLSEELLGRALKAVRQDVVICTKFSQYVAGAGADNFETSKIRPGLEGSLRRLQTDYVDILLLHNPPRELMDGNQAPQYEELERLKAEGLIREYGVSLDWREDLETVVRTTGSKAIEVYFNAFYQEPLPAFERAQEKGVGLIVKVPLDSGWLAGRYRSEARFEGVRERWTPEVIARRGALIEAFAALVPKGRSLSHTALQYCLAQHGVSTVIPGAKTIEQALDNMSAANDSLAPEVVQQIKALWERELRDAPLPW